MTILSLKTKKKIKFSVMNPFLKKLHIKITAMLLKKKKNMHIGVSSSFLFF